MPQTAAVFDLCISLQFPVRIRSRRHVNIVGQFPPDTKKSMRDERGYFSQVD